MDRIDRAILEQLRRDCRQSNTEIADLVGLTPSPCLRRIRRLEEDGIIQGYHARVDPVAIGRGFEVHVDFELKDQAKSTIREFEAALVAFDEVIEARRTFGAPDYQALVAVADLQTYELFMTEHLADLPGLAKLQSRFTMKTLKANVPANAAPDGANR
ncbi:Lrp/AsnC family transcriptional regulator [Lentzea sp. CA-135723]|uniref:Lrp/AsnC family transcriptional regulator n=1 Tax=Lentzea sp. CA-135723 TaxID=3239950 RepID=UPI003D909BE9